MKSVDKEPSGRSRVIACIAIFLLAFAVRALTWHDTRLEVGKVQTAVIADYQRVARLLRDGGVKSLFSQSSPLADLNNLGHPPGYSLLIASVYSFKPSDAAIQFVQITLDSFSDVLIFLIVAEFLPLSAGVVAGLLAAFSPQLAWNSVLLLPDAISVLPILLAIFLLARAVRNPRLVMFIAIGAFVGVSCWLRANALFLSLFFAAASWLIIKERPRAWRFALAVICGTGLIVLPLTIRNAIVFHRFIPLSLGAGQTFLEGMADYDRDGKFGIPNTDVGIMKQEAEIYRRPDYYGTLFNPDGVERERARLSRGFAIVRAHPVWFAGVMARRASSMLRLERSRLISTDPPVSHSIDAIDRLQPIWSRPPDELVAEGLLLSSQAQTSLVSDTCCWLTLMGDASRYGDQFSSPVGTVNKDVDYVLMVPIDPHRGRIRISVKSSTGRIYSTAVAEAAETVAPSDASIQSIALPFVASESGQPKLVFSNEASTPPNPIMSVTEIKLYELGPARFLWTRYPRTIIHAIQKIFLTAVILPLALAGFLILVFRKDTTALVLFSTVPIYFFTAQSAVHTEYRYVLAVDYFLFAFAGVAIAQSAWFIGRLASGFIRKPKA
jgi:dolichyl-phosphate-mannose-protein mannosyltransferase